MDIKKKQGGPIKKAVLPFFFEDFVTMTSGNTGLFRAK